MVVFGTGKLIDVGDQSDVSVQSAYGIWDPATFAGPGTFATVNGRSTLVSITVAQETNAMLLNANAGSTTNSGATTFYKTTASRSIDWSKDNGWYTDYLIAPGQRSTYPVEPLKQLVRIDTIAPRINANNCAPSTTLGYNLLVDPLTGLCTTRTTLDTNNDKVIDSNDSPACIYSSEADGQDVVLDILDASGLSTGFVDIQDSNGHFTIRADDPPPQPPLAAGSGIRRDWRQIFPRQ
jgi:Tfp pilus tip-associated adhesin PilY1